MPRIAANTHLLDKLMGGGQQAAMMMPAKAVPAVGRNETCPCGSGKKFKKCCGK
jgi:uncharacterized protein YecA (UPF0149 family)